MPNSMSASQQAVAPAAASSNIAPIRKKSILQIDPRLLSFEEGFNLREDTDDVRVHIDSIKSTIRSGGVVPPVIFRKVGEKNLLIDGHCRTRAYHELIAEGVEILYMDAMEFQGSDAERVALMLSSAQALPLKPIERGNGYLRLQRYGWSVQQIAERTGLSDTAIYQSIQLVKLDSAIQQMVKSGDVSAKTALEAVQEYGDKAPKILAKIIEREKSKGRKVTRKSLAIPSVPPKHLKTVFQNAERLVDTLDNETRVRLAELESKPAELVQQERISVEASLMIELLRAVGESKEAQRKRIKQEQLVLPTADDSLLDI